MLMIKNVLTLLYSVFLIEKKQKQNRLIDCHSDCRSFHIPTEFLMPKANLNKTDFTVAELIVYPSFK